MLIVSHDRELLGLMDQIADLRSDHYGDSLRLYGGNLAAYEAMLAAEQAAARRVVSAADADVRRGGGTDRGQTKQARRDRQGRQLSASGSLPHRGGRTPAVGAGDRRAVRDIQPSAVADAQARLAEAEEAVRDDDAIRISLPGTAVPAGRTVLTVTGLDGSWMPWRPETVRGDREREATGTGWRRRRRSRRRAGRAHCSGTRTGRADRAERGGQDHPAPDHRRPTRRARARGWCGTARVATCRSGSTCSTTR